MNKKLVLITAGFPFGAHETFLETEIRYLCEGFEQVTIVAVDPTSDKQRTVPSNCTVVALDAQLSGLEKLLSSLGIFNKRVWQELRIIKKVYHQRLTLGKLKTILISLARAQKIRRKLEILTPLDDQTVLYSYWCDDAALALSLLKKQLPEVKTVSRIHRWDVYFDQNTYNYLPFRTLITDQLNTIFSISRDGIDYAKRVWQVSGDNMVLSRLGIEPQPNPLPKNRDEFLIVSCSNIIPVKRVNLIASALMHVKSDSIRWVHFGEGPEMESLKKQIAELPSNIIVELRGRVPNKEIFAFYLAEFPDVFINVSASEGVPVSIMEAMSFGIPVVATDVGGNSEIVNERNGRLLPLNFSVDRLSAYIQVFMNATIRNQCGDEAIKTWNNLYNAKKNYADFCDQLKV